STSIDTVAVSIDTANMPGMQAEMMKKMYPDGMKMAFAGWGKSVGISMGPKAVDQMGGLIDAKEGKPLSPFAQAAIDASAKRKDRMVMVMNRAAMMNPMAQLPAAQSGMVCTIGFTNGRAGMRMNLPAAHIGEMMAAFKTVGQPPR